MVQTRFVKRVVDFSFVIVMLVTKVTDTTVQVRTEDIPFYATFCMFVSFMSLSTERKVSFIILKQILRTLCTLSLSVLVSHRGRG